jgi:hypothetical protein
MRHHTGTVANVDPVKPINGKKLVWILAVGSVLFTVVMGFGTYFLAKIMAPMLQKHPAASSTQAPNSSNSVSP